jgi:peptide/nickel transport system substrate-binding protein
MSRREAETSNLQNMFDTSISRRGLLKRGAAFGLTIPIGATLLAACDPEDADTVDDADPVDDLDDPEEDPVAEPEDDPDEDPIDEQADDDAPVEEIDEMDDDTDIVGDGQEGGSLNVALIGEPPTLDIHQSTADIVSLITWHIYEPLFTWDENYEIMPELAATHEVSDDGLTQTIELRDGVTFHNGDELTVEDVIASFERWTEISGLGADLREVTDDVEDAGDGTVIFHLSEPFGAFATLLSRQSQGCAIYPASVIEASDLTGLDEYVGTGPYQFVEHVADQHILVERFDDYAQPDFDEPHGYGGYKHQYLDEIYFIPVPDEAARVAGLQAGDFHYLQDVSPDNFDTLDQDENITAETVAPAAWSMLVLNTAEGVMSNQTLRQAVLAALDHEEIAQAAYGDGFYIMDPAIMHQETAWHTTAGEEFYNQNDPDRAAELMEEAGYDGEPIRLATTQEYSYMYYTAVVTEQQLEDAGFTVELEVYDWATLTEVREDPEQWDIFTTGNTFRVDPVMQPYVAGTSWPGWWDSEEKVQLSNQLLTESDFDTRYEIFEQFQELFYEEVPIIKIADEATFNARSASLGGFTGQIQLSPAFWNMWIEG